MKTDLLDSKTWATYFSETTKFFNEIAMGYAPKIVGAILVLVIGIFIAKLFKWVGFKIGLLITKIIASGENKETKGRRHISKNNGLVLGQFLYWSVLVYFVFLSFRVLNIPGLTEWIIYYTRFIPNLIGALIIIYVGFVLGLVAKNFVISRKTKLFTEAYNLLPFIAQYGIITVFVIWGVEQAGFNASIIINIISIIVAAIFGAAALGFGLGASKHVANLIGAFNFKKSFRIGDTVAIADLKGTIVDITNNTIVLETSEGLMLIPARQALDSICQKGD